MIGWKEACYDLGMSRELAPWKVVDGQRARIEAELVRLVFTPGPAPQPEWDRLMKQLEPRPRSFVLLGVPPILR